MVLDIQSGNCVSACNVNIFRITIDWYLTNNWLVFDEWGL